MCGLAGCIGLDINKEKFEKSLLSMEHRGPDSYGIERIPKLEAILGHVRLSIIDTSEAGTQPMQDSTGKFILVFNGEIYNYKQIRKKLQNLGVQFQSQSDSEVLLEAFKIYKEKVLDLLEGMYAFLILDKTNRKCFFARDRFGVKPFYYKHSQNDFLFASEIKVIKNLQNSITIDTNSRYNYFKTGYIPANSSIYKEVKPLMPGCYGIYNLESNTLEIGSYWNSINKVEKSNKRYTKSEILEITRSFLKESFRLRMVSDVPVGIFLSGGIDSALLAGILKKELNYDFSTFTIGFNDEQYDESKIAASVANHLDLENVIQICEFEDFKNEFNQMYRYFDEPFADSSAPLTMLVSKLAKKHVKVSLSADGGDEFFGGYSKYYTNLKKYKALLSFPNSLSRLTSVLLDRKISTDFESNNIGRLGVKEMAKNLIIENRYNNKRIIKNEGVMISDLEISSFSNNEIKGVKNRNGNFIGLDSLSNIEILMLHDVNNYMLGDILKKVDMATMSKSLEGREPFLDHHLYEFLFSVKSQDKFFGKQNKPILRELVYQYIPREIIDLPKKGFGAPLEKWSLNLINEYKEFLYDIFTDKGWSIQYLDILFRLSKNSNTISSKLWIILNYLRWEEVYKQ